MTRMFVAAYPSPEAVEDLDEFLDVRREAGDFRWAPPALWHLTLAFFAEVPGRSLDPLVEGVERAAAKRSAMAATISGAGAFPHIGRAKVLWAGVEVEDSHGLERLAKASRAAGATVGAPPAGERFQPHLTLARINPPIEATKWVRLLDSYRGPAWQLDHVALVSSHLGQGPRKRPRHEVIETFRLADTVS